jgi:plasmid maintenance system antidote protein VapI
MVEFGKVIVVNLVMLFIILLLIAELRFMWLKKNNWMKLFHAARDDFMQADHEAGWWESQYRRYFKMIDCGHGCDVVYPYGFVPEDGCPVHDVFPEVEIIGDSKEITIVPMPGKIIQNELNVRHWTAEMLAERLCWKIETVNKMILGELKITRNIAERLAGAFDTSVMMWENLETNYREWKKQENDSNISADQ